MSGNRGKGRGRGRKKKEDIDDEPLYCICKSPDISRFMIGCDKCEEWYHGDCISVTPKQAENIKTFYCHLCKRKDPTLVIEYKGAKNVSSLPKKRGRKRRMSSRQNSMTNGEPQTKRSRGRGRPAMRRGSDEDEDIDDEATDDEMETAGVEPDDEDDDEDSGVRHRVNMDDDSRNLDVLVGHDSDLLEGPVGDVHVGDSAADLDLWCGECIGCRRSQPCNKCDVCRESRRRGSSPGHDGLPKCRMMRCIDPPELRSPSQVGRVPAGGSMVNRHGNHQTRARGRHAAYEQHSPLMSHEMKDDFDSSLDSYGTSPSRRYFSNNNLHRQRRTPTHSNVGRNSTHNHTGPGGPYPGPSSQLDFGGVPMRSGRNSSGLTPSGTLNRRLIPAGGVPLPHKRVRGNSGGSIPGNRLPQGMMHRILPGMMDPHQEPELSDTDEEIMLPDYSHCLGPACMMPARPGNKFCSEDCATKQNNSRGNYRNMPGSRFQSAGHPKDLVTTPYTLSYPDHLYCKHHRYFNWHGDSVDPNVLTSTPGIRGNVGSGAGVGTAHLHHSISPHPNTGFGGGLSMLHHPLQHQDQVAAAAMAALAQGAAAPEDYYTISETDNLEINWPQETLPGAVTG